MPIVERKSARHRRVHRIPRPRFVTIGRSAPLKSARNGRDNASDLGLSQATFCKSEISEGPKSAIRLKCLIKSGFWRADVEDLTAAVSPALRM
jgi:hypothetical protein